ncbi:MAG: metal-dependent transcriptional regulator [Deltaproteobacteria bacterium]|nr:metal-dependent transcriptional regulator [Deltaproteobacteria bacterium]
MVSKPTDRLTGSLEDYLETIYDLLREHKVARVKDIARLRCVKPGSVSPAMRRLAALGLIRYEQREFIDLTAKGEARARQVVARHQILSTFFRDILQMSPRAADKDACAMEHTLSTEAMDRLARLVEVLESDPALGVTLLDRLKTEIGGSKTARRANRKTTTARSRRVKLTELRPGETGLVKAIRARGKKRQRLLELGALPEAEVRMERPATRRKGFVVLLQGFAATLTREQAETVIVTRQA